MSPPDVPFKDEDVIFKDEDVTWDKDDAGEDSELAASYATYMPIWVKKHRRKA